MKQPLLLCLVCTLVLTLWAMPASAALEDRAFSEDLKRFGEWIGEGLEKAGSELAEFSRSPKEYIEGVESLNALMQAMEGDTTALQTLWPMFSPTAEEEIQAILDADLPWEEKKVALQAYGVLAIPYLVDIDFDQISDNARAAMETLKDFLSTDNEEVVREWMDENRQRLKDFGEYMSR